MMRGTKADREKHRMNTAQQEALTAWLFILPFAIGFLIFYALPTVISLVVSFTDLRFISNISEASFVGLQNFLAIFKDSNAMAALGHSFYYTLLYVPLILTIGFFMAVFVNQKMFAKGFIRTSLFMPFVSSFVAIAIVWSFLLDPKQGIINNFLRDVGVQNPPLWLMGIKTVIPSVVIIVVWQSVGFYMITFLAALHGVSETLYEAAEIDGASKWQQIWNVTLPSISPTVFFLLISAMINSFQNFAPIQILTGGGPGKSSVTFSYHIYQTSFVDYRMGFATAEAMILFVVILVITFVQWYGQKKWVNY